MLKRRANNCSMSSNNINVPNRSLSGQVFKAQKKGNRLQDSLLQFYKSGSHTDVNIHVRWRGETTEFRAHQLVLGMRSPVFAHEFHSKGSIITFVVEGVNPQLIKLLIWYFYSDELIAESPKQIIGFAKVAKYYQVGGVNLACKEALSHYTVEERNVWGLLDATIYFKMEQLRQTCTEFLRKDLKRILLLPEFLTISRETLYFFETEFSLHLTRNEWMEAILRWLQHNKQADRSVLSICDIASFSIDEFLDMLEAFPSFLSPKDALAILANKLRSNIMELPRWYDSTSKPVASSEDTVSISVATVVDRSLRIETSFEEQLSKSLLFGVGGFKCAMTFQLKLAKDFPQPLNVIMLELAFGSSFVPEDNLDIKIFSYQHGIRTIKKKQLEFLLHSTPDNYYIISKELCNLDRIVPFIFTLHVQAKELRRWRENEPLPNNRYRVLQIPQNNTLSISLSVGANEVVTLTTLSDWLAFVDPKEGTKSFVFSAFYFDKE